MSLDDRGSRAAGSPVVMGLVALLAVLCSACGAKTGLRVPVLDASMRDDVMYSDVRPARCNPIRVHTRVGFAATLRPEPDALPRDGYHWSIVSRPENSTAELQTDGSDTALLTPDREGIYDVRVGIETDRADGGVLECQITVIVDPPEARCPGYALVEPRIVTLGTTGAQLAMDRAWGETAAFEAPGASGQVFDDTEARVAALVFSRPARVPSGDPIMVAVNEGSEVERVVEESLGATPLLVGRMFATREGLPYRRSTLRVAVPTPSTTDAGALRDRAIRALLGVPPPRTPPPEVTAGTFYVEVTTVFRIPESSIIVFVAVAPTLAFDDARMFTAFRVNDLNNTTPLNTLSATLDVECHAVPTTRMQTADFLWLVDVSGSMNDDQQRLGDVATQFFQRLNTAGVDFRVGVMEAGHFAPALGGPPPFQWIAGSDTNGARRMAYQVTMRPYRGAADDNLRPFPVRGNMEEPVSAGVVAVREFERRRAVGESNPDFVLREGAVHVVFFVTDEPGTANDDARFFATMPAEWGTTPGARIRAAANFFQSRGIIPFGLVRADSRADCTSSAVNFPSCVITLAGGAFIPIDLRVESAANAAFEAAMIRIVDSVAGAASEFTLPIEPVSSTVRVRIEARLTPRSRVDGFDYDERTRALVFRGNTYRPRVGQTVRAAYFRWR